MKMKHIYGTILIGWLAVQYILNLHEDIIGIASLLGALCLFIVKERYFDNPWTSIIYLLVAVALAQYDPKFILLSGIPLVDFAYTKKFFAAVLILVALSAFGMLNASAENVFYLITAGLFGYITGQKDENEQRQIALLDRERRLRYNLEQAQNELLHSRQEIEQLIEIRERNRIAHEIHDNIGHSIAGIIFQMEAAIRILPKDLQKAEGIMKLCSQKLAEALELTRNTVYNIRVDKKIGLAAIEKIINDFTFCPVTFEHKGDFSTVSAANIKILEANVMESLTNAAKHSRASAVQIKIDISSKNIRYFYHDNGVGCQNIRENLGLAGMRERVRDAGGTISVDGNEGFLIVCNLPAATGRNREG